MQLLRRNGRQTTTNQDYINMLKLELNSKPSVGNHMSESVAEAAKLRLTFLEVGGELSEDAILT